MFRKSVMVPNFGTRIFFQLSKKILVPNFETRSQKCHQAVFLVGNIAGSLIAFLAFVAFLNGVLSW